MGSFDTLSRLLAPETSDHFLAEIWEKHSLHVPASDARRFDALLTDDDVDRALTTLHLRHPEVSLIDAARKREPEDFTYPSGLIDVVRLYRCFDEGSTILLSNLELRHGPLALLCRALEREIGHRVQANVYFTPRNAQGFRAHFDNHDVLVLQVRGTKQWLLYDTPVELPLPAQEFNPEETKPGAITAQMTLRPGDVLYVPRGMMHDARATNEESLHVTLGIMSRSWLDLLTETIADLALDDVRFRKAIPPGFHQGDFALSAAKEHFASLLAALSAEGALEGAIARMSDELLDARHAIVPGQLAQIRAARALTDASVFSARASLMYRVERDEESVTVHAHGRTLTLPAHVIEPLRYALEAREFTEKMLPGDLDAEGRMVLLRRLVREGMIEVLR